MSNRRRQTGFTFVELLAAMSVAGVLSGLAWPSFRYLLAGVRASVLPSYVAAGLHTTLPVPDVPVDDDDVEAAVPNMTPIQQEAEAAAALVDKAVQLVIPAIDTTQPAAPSPGLPFAAKLRDAFDGLQGDAGWFVVRCAYVRCDCGPLKPTLLSAPSVQFQLAGFFDPVSASQGTATARFFGTTVSWLFIVINGHLLVIGALVDSFRAFPVGPEPFAFLRTALPHQWGAEIFGTGLWIALPLLAMLLFVNVVLGMISRVASQINVFAVGFPITLGVGLIGILLTLPLMQAPFMVAMDKLLAGFR